ncbi:MULTISPECIES: aldo/keto reductase [Marivita]|uniref:Aldo/keto reductase n=1 Tax=Marivita cryptomonadis TaxID=505252 RepID=A0A9Q2P699_9RHOB|nr:MULTISPECIES: aldo/keto reductase [Marivita]MCR9168180.1 aldo/keto reductase [Paracoccaceae bacterium]MBM2323055.1 aldo/keto reductase [Marivita cryptomonadis]MBM2332638.1 aldo/keto reductase [Marivita cryptomonadis]MBM2342221.1 aldo/keto reductase [Marivita cryptomonadis]MBM2346886.1 aldo/keto reductase [Marivita cryptomonadis]
MKMNRLGKTDLMVSELCLGTMTYGNQTPESDAHTQMNMALDAGINFIDAAEMYPVNPIAKETIGLTEEILGNWFKQTGRRNEWILATKHSGEGMEHARNGAPISSETVPEAVEGSLKRLKTDHIDLYQLHWPNRGSYMFRKNWTFDPTTQNRNETLQNMADVLGALGREIEKGRIRHIGLSNESAWGTMMWLQVAQAMAGPRMESIQNEYSLMCRMADTDLAEVMVHEEVSLLPFSPLAAGLLTGKYQNGAVPDGSRMAINGNLGGRKTDRAFEAVDAYAKVAQEAGLDMALMALAWSAQRPFVASSIFGATTADQLAHLLRAEDVRLSAEVLKALDETHKKHPMPY